MPTIQVNKQGAVLYYEDSGAPHGQSHYRTIFLIHGLIFHSAIFRPMFQYAEANNLRFIALNMREYPGSSPFTDEEFERFQSSDSRIQSVALRDQAFEVASAIAQLIETQDIPAPQQDGERQLGGVSILAWSIANCVIYSLFSNIAQLDPRVSAVLDRHLRTFFMYDPPSPIIGSQLPPGVITPMDDPTIPDTDRTAAFISWVSSFCNPLPTAEAVTPETLQTRYDMHELSADPRFSPTASRISPSELASISSPELAARVLLVLLFRPEVFDKNLRHSIFDTKGLWKDVKIVGLSSDMSPSIFAWAFKVISDMLEMTPGEGEVRRKCDMVKLTGKNHFWHYEDPEPFVRFLAEHI
ncbi:alpha/beta-hydrolase [Trametopsis cervina]|nr:alpha/beta-hydrolase [Trametopsis cervina]